MLKIKGLIFKLIGLSLFSSVLLCYGNYSYADTEIIFSCGAEDKKEIALTFDDGPHPEYTEKIISILQKYNVTATFFAVGVNIKNYPDIVKYESECGYEIGNHTYYHKHISSMNKDELKSDIIRSSEEIKKETGASPTLFRPPEGVCNSSVKQLSRELGYSIILWTVDTKDWTMPTPEQIVKTVTANVRPGAIILFHDYVSGPSSTPEALETLIPYLLSEGYTFLTVSELLGI